MFFLNGAFFGAWAARIPSIKNAFNLESDTLGLLLLLLAGGAVASFPLAGAFSDRFGASTVTKLIAWAYATALIFLGLAPNIPLFAAAIFLFGATHGAMDVAMNSWGAEVERSIKRPIMSGLHAMFSLGAGFGAACGVIATKFDLSVGSHFAIFAVLITFPSLSIANVQWSSARLSSDGKRQIFAFPKVGLLLVGVIAFCASLSEGAMADWSAVFLVETVAATETEAALGYTVFSASMVIMRLLGDRVIAALGAARSARASGLVAAIGACLAILGGSVWTTLIGFALMGLGFAVIMPLAFSRAAIDAHTSSGAGIAGVATLGYGGMLLGPPIIGFAASLTNFQMAFGLIAALAFIIIFLGGTLRES